MEVPLRSKLCSPTFLPVTSLSRSSSRASARMESSVRRRLIQYNSFDHAVQLLQASSKIIVLTGAGISTSLGIRDFRSEKGLYAFLKNHGISDPQELFHIQTFRDDPNEFFDVVRHLLPPAETRHGPTHAFIKLLQDKGKLLTNYTQNIDDLEHDAAIDDSKIVQCHGSLATAKCTGCGHAYKGKHYLPVLRNPKRRDPPLCWRCWGKDGVSPNWKNPKRSKSGNKKRKRSEFDDDDSENDDPPTGWGILKPGIVFFGEQIADLFRPRFERDKDKVDLLVIIGTSLQVEPVKNIPRDIPPAVPQIYIGLKSCDPREGFSPDIQLLGECDVIVEELSRRAGWKLEHKMVEPVPNPVRVELIEATTNRYMVRRAVLPASKPVRTPLHSKSDPIVAQPVLPSVKIEIEAPVDRPLERAVDGGRQDSAASP